MTTQERTDELRKRLGFEILNGVIFPKGGLPREADPHVCQPWNALLEEMRKSDQAHDKEMMSGKIQPKKEVSPNA